MSLELIKKLRDNIGAGMSDCKKAVEESDGTYDDAVRILRERGQQIATKKSSNAASEGLVGWVDNGAGILVVELNCQTDFVTRGDKFPALLENILNAAKLSKAIDTEAVLNSKIGEQLVKDFIIENIAVIGENIKLGRVHFVNYNADFAGVYVHNAITEKPNLGVIASVVTIKSDNESAKEIARKVAMHVTAAVPSDLSIADVSATKIEAEKAILKEQMKDEKKPESIMEKIIAGKIDKFFQDVVLLEQPSIFDNGLKIKDWVAAEAKTAGISSEVTSFVRIKLGDFASEQA
jgi:elongation factor Ts